jgi:hypothetical protein
MMLFVGTLRRVGILNVRVSVVSLIENPSQLLRRVRDRIQFVALLLASGEARRGNISRQWGCDRGATTPETKSNATLWAAVILSQGFVVRSSQIRADMLVALASPWHKLPGGKLYSIPESPQV